jgi:hypothetical protein
MPASLTKSPTRLAGAFDAGSFKGSDNSGYELRIVHRLFAEPDDDPRQPFARVVLGLAVYDGVAARKLSPRVCEDDIEPLNIFRPEAASPNDLERPHALLLQIHRTAESIGTNGGRICCQSSVVIVAETCDTLGGALPATRAADRFDIASLAI